MMCGKETVTGTDTHGGRGGVLSGAFSRDGPWEQPDIRRIPSCRMNESAAGRQKSREAYQSHIAG
jgi:hypothetical protein